MRHRSANWESTTPWRFARPQVRSGVCFGGLLAAFVVLLLSGCSAEPGPATTNASPEPAVVPGTDLPQSRLESFQALLPPSDEDWESEAFAEAAQTQLETLAHLVTAGSEPTLAEVETLVAEGFRATSLVPSSRERVFHDDVVSVWHAGPAAEPAHDCLGAAEALLQAVAQLRRSLGKASTRRLHVEIVEARREGASGSCTVRIDAGGEHGDGQAAQQTSVWNCRFAIRDSAPPRLVSIELADLEQLVRHRNTPPLLTDATHAVVGADAAYADQFLAGVDHWRTSLPFEFNPQGDGWHGLAVGDVNGDGLDDLYVCQGGGLPNRLLVQNADGTTSDRAAAAGADWLDATRAALLVDLNNDGAEDLVLALARGLVWMAGDGDGRFMVRGQQQTRGEPFSLAAADYDADGLVDVYVSSYLSAKATSGTSGYPFPVPFHDARNGSPNTLFRNRGSWRFEDVTAEVGLDSSNDRFSTAAVWEDFDNDGDQDLYVANDFGRNNLFRNQGGKFTEMSRHDFGHPGSSTAACWADVDHDGRLDLFVANRHAPAGLRITQQIASNDESKFAAGLRGHAEGNTLLRNLSDGRFRRLGSRAGLMRTGRPWAAALVDLNNDGWHDLLAANGFASGPRQRLDSFFWRRVAAASPRDGQRPSRAYARGWKQLGQLIENGFSLDGHQRNRAFVNVGGFRFADVSAVSGFDLADDARAMAVTDWDQDGRPDAWLANRNGPRIRFFRNQYDSGHHFVAFRLEGRNANRDAIGARLTLTLTAAADAPRLATVRAGDGSLSQSTKWITFGLGNQQQIDRLDVRWPDGSTQTFRALAADCRYRVVQGDELARQVPARLTAVEWNVPAASPTLAITPRPRIVLAPRPAMVALNGTPPAATRTSSPSARLLLLWSPRSDPCRRQLDELAREAAQFRRHQVAIVTVDVDTSDHDSGANGEALPAPLDETAVRVAEPAAFLRRFGVLYQTLFDRAAPLPLPACLLLDSDGAVAVLYCGHVAAAQIVDDLELLELPPDRLRDAAAPLAGRWFEQPVAADPLRVVRAFSAAGQAGEAIAYLQAIVEKLKPPAADADGERHMFDLAAARVVHHLGTLLMEQERGDEAIDRFRRALEFAPQYAPALVDLGRLLAHRGDARDAAAALETALRLDGQNDEALHQLAMLRHRQGDVSAAIALWNEALRVRPDRVASANNLAWVLATTNDPRLRDVPRAVELARFACQVTEFAQPRFLDTLASAYAEAGQPAEAAKALKRAIELMSESADSRTVDALRQRLRDYEARSKPPHAPLLLKPGR